MTDQITVDGKEYISSKRASQLSGYSQDYIGQLSRGAQIDAQRVAGLWYVRMESLEQYKKTAEAYKPEPPMRNHVADPDSLVNFDGKDYASAARAAKITGYHQDYVGQLARSGTVLARQVGNRWYVEREGIVAHKKEKDALLAAVQRESVGLASTEGPKLPQDEKEILYPAEDQFTYTKDGGDLMPIFKESPEPSFAQRADFEENVENFAPVAVPIRVVESKEILHHTDHVKRVKSQGKSTRNRNTVSYVAAGAMVFTIVVVLMFGLSTLGKSSMFAAAGSTGYTGSVGRLFSKLGDFLEKILVQDLVYKRSD